MRLIACEREPNEWIVVVAVSLDGEIAVPTLAIEGDIVSRDAHPPLAVGARRGGFIETEPVFCRDPQRKIPRRRQRPDRRSVPDWIQTPLRDMGLPGLPVDRQGFVVEHDPQQLAIPGREPGAVQI